MATLLLGAAGCGNLAAADDLASARRRWEAWGPATYEVTVRRSCECLPDMVEPVIVAVRNREIQSRTYVRTGTAVDQRFTEYFPDVPGLFDLIAETATQGSTVEVRYDAVTGAPLEIIVDRESWAVDGGFGMYVQLITPK